MFRNEYDGLEPGVSVDLDKADTDGNTVLHIAVLNDDTDLVQQFVAEGVDIAIRNAYGETPLHIAAQQGDLFMMQSLLGIRIHTEKEKIKHDVICRKALHKKDADGDTPLLIAARKNDVDMIIYLLEKGASVLAFNHKYETALELAIFKNNIRAVEAIVSKNQECLKLKNANGYLPLHQAVMLNRFEIVKWFLDFAGANLFEESSHYNVTALSLAAKHSDKTMVHILLSRGAGIKADLTEIDLSGLDLSHYVFIGAEDDGGPIPYEGIKTAMELHEAKLKGAPLYYRALCLAITTRLIEYPEDKELLQAQKIVKDIPRNIAARYNIRPLPTKVNQLEETSLRISCKRA